MGTFVTLAEVLEARGSPLDEDEVWCLLLATTDALLEISKKGNLPSSPSQFHNFLRTGLDLKHRLNNKDGYSHCTH